MSDLLLLCRIYFLKHFKIIIASCCVFTRWLRRFSAATISSSLAFFIVKTTLLTCNSIKRSWLASSWSSPIASTIFEKSSPLFSSHMHFTVPKSASQPRFTCFAYKHPYNIVFTRMMRIFRNAAKWLIACCLCINANQVAGTGTGSGSDSTKFN